MGVISEAKERQYEEQLTQAVRQHQEREERIEMERRVRRRVAGKTGMSEGEVHRIAESMKPKPNPYMGWAKER